MSDFPVRPQCPHGGPAPCVDDLCNSSDRTLCGIDLFNDPDICEHGYIAGCDVCDADPGYDEDDCG